MIRNNTINITAKHILKCISLLFADTVSAFYPKLISARFYG